MAYCGQPPMTTDHHVPAHSRLYNFSKVKVPQLCLTLRPHGL